MVYVYVNIPNVLRDDFWWSNWVLILIIQVTSPNLSSWFRYLYNIIISTRLGYDAAVSIIILLYRLVPETTLQYSRNSHKNTRTTHDLLIEINIPINYHHNNIGDLCRMMHNFFFKHTRVGIIPMRLLIYEKKQPKHLSVDSYKLCTLYCNNINYDILYIILIYHVHVLRACLYAGKIMRFIVYDLTTRKTVGRIDDRGSRGVI